MATTGGAVPPRSGDHVVRRATDADHEAIVELAGAALGWRRGEPNREQFRWKHVDGAFGPSALWVAEGGHGALLAFRAMLRWRFLLDGTPVDAVRAVDTATHPDHRGRGLFRQLTMQAVDELRAEGVGFVFNTPNENSRPGYLKMGWQVVGRVPVGIRVSSPLSMARLVRARVPAEKWSTETTAGEPAEAAFVDDGALGALLASVPASSGVVTDRSVDYLRWRYTAGPVRYRVAFVGRSAEDGLAFFRVRRRGTALEATITEVLVPGASARGRRTLVGNILRASRADYAIGTQRQAWDGLQVRLPGQGPVLTDRPLALGELPAAAAWDLSMGDVELF